MSKPKIARPRPGVNRSTSNDTPAVAALFPEPSKVETPNPGVDSSPGFRPNGKGSLDRLEMALSDAGGWREGLALTVADIALAVAETDAERSATEPIMEALKYVALLGEQLRAAKEASHHVGRVVVPSLLNVLADCDAKLVAAGVHS